MKPLAIDLFCGLGGWTEGLMAEGFDVIGFDIESHVYGNHRYPAQLVVQDVLSLAGAQFRDAALIVASPPCQEYSYMAMPWTRAKAIAAALRGDGEFPEGYTGSRALAELNALFDACFRIQREACEAAGRHIPLIVENVRGAQPWVGRARWSYGSYYLWGDVPALMPPILKAQKSNPDGTDHGPGSWFAIADSKDRGARKTRAHPNQRDGHDHTRHLTNAAEHGIKNGGDWFGSGKDCSFQRRFSGSEGRKFTIGKPGGPTVPRDPIASAHGAKRKFASAMIAKIPLPLARHIAATFARAV